jgi:DNA-directed RNA polymerase subunit RPC12/RpoP
MAVAQGSCPNCGAPIAFEVGSSISKVCEYCRHTVLRSDRGLENLGKVSDLAHTPALIAVGDEGALRGRALRVLGRVQLDHGAGPWDEYYVALDHGRAWGWLAFAQGRWYATVELPDVALLDVHGLLPDRDLNIPGAGFLRVAEVKEATITSTEGELPGVIRVGQRRRYADCYGLNGTFATLDYGDGSTRPTLYFGQVFNEPELQVTALGPRSVHKLKMTSLRCPNCGGDVPSLSGERAERVGCPYCGAVSDIAGQRVISLQEAARKSPDIPIGSRGTLDRVDYVCIALVRRGTDFDGDHYSWDEYLLWSAPVGYRWLVKDPETGWSFVSPVNPAELDLTSQPTHVTYAGKGFRARNQNRASVEYVLGEVYWKVSVGDFNYVADYTYGGEVLSREQAGAEVSWSHSRALAWPTIASAFGLPVNGPGANLPHLASSGGGGAGSQMLALLVVAVFLLLCAMATLDDCSGGGGGYVGGGTFRGGGVFSGGK